MGKIAIIGGSGFDNIPAFTEVRRDVIKTPFGMPSSDLVWGRLEHLDLVFVARHGEKHLIPPHRINYRANLYALHLVGIQDVIALAAVGGIHPGATDGSIVFPDQVIDYTWGREHTYYDNETCPESRFNGALDHVDFTSPYSAQMRQRVLEAARRAGVSSMDRGVYAVTQGPRLESAAEINRLERDGADIVGMTAMPEAALARELGMSYACIAMVVNAAAGRGPETISMELIHRNLAIAKDHVMKILRQLS